MFKTAALVALKNELTASMLQRRCKEEEGASKKELTAALLHDIELAGIKHLVYALKVEQLTEAVDMLEIDHKDNNPKNKMVLTKRLKESMKEEGVKQWIGSCDNAPVLENFARALNIRGFTTMGVRVLRKAVEDEIMLAGSQIVFGNLNLNLLKQCCELAKIPNYETTSSKKPLIQAIVFQLEIAAPVKAKRKPTRKPKFAQIEDCETYDQLFQHYKLQDLVNWCNDNGVKSYGTKKVVIQRILAYLSGDKENTMSSDKVNKPRATKPKAAPKKAATPTTSRKSRKAEKEPEPEPEPESEPEEEEEDEAIEDVEEAVEERSAEPEEDDEEEDDEPKTASEASEEVVAPESEVDESESIRMESSETNALEGVVVAAIGKINKERVFDIVVKNGGVAHKDAKLNKKINYLVVDDPKKEKYQRAKKLGIEIVGEQWINQYE
mmetsp:Transcript_31150/g.53295  ORF Transcript_31150/g.53295 Transcript_31150/m.53295 type:complete len:438 (-) Transcript_31150:83-1396(-)